MMDRQQKIIRAANGLMLAVAMGLITGNLLLPMAVGTEDLLRYYAYAALLLELLLLYVPGDKLLKAMGGMERKATAGELLWSVLLGVGAMFLTTGINALLTGLWDALGVTAPAGAMPRGDGWRIPAAILVLGIVPAYAEETLFRGALLRAWLPLGERRALWRTAIFFALIHLNPTSLPALLPVSLILGITAIKTRTLGAPMAVHMANNIPAVLLSMAAADVAAEEVSLTFGELLGPALVYLLLGGLACVFCWRGLMRSTDAAMKAKPLPPPAEQEKEATEPAPPQYRPGVQHRLPSGNLLLALAYLLLIGINLALLAAMFLAPELMGV